MDDDEEIQSHTSAATGSPSPSPPNGRITVTVAAGPPQQMPPQQQNSNALAIVPIHQPKNSNGGGREDCWSEAATAVLIEAWGERYLELSRGNLKQKHWKEVADIVSSREDYNKVPKTDIQCKNRIDTVKKKYKLEKAKIAAGGGPSKWPFYHRLDHLIGPTAKIPATAASSGANKVPVGIPVGVRGGSGSNSYQFHQGKSQSKNNQAPKSQNAKSNPRKRGPVETESSSDDDEDNFLESEEEDDVPPPPEKKPRVMLPRGATTTTKPLKEKKNWGNSMRMLTQAILKFGEAYEQAESAKLQQVVEMEKTRMKFAKELELQRMQFFMKTQMEISQLKRRGGGGGGGGGNGSSNNHHSHHHHLHHGNNVIVPKNNNSDSDN